jgi:hypothetical protein
LKHPKDVVLAVCLVLLTMAVSPISAQSHPRLLFDGVKGREAWVKRMNQPHLRDYRDMLIEQADKVMGHEDGTAWKIYSQRPVQAFSSLPYAYLLTGDEKYLKMFLEVAKLHTERFKWDPKVFQAEFTLNRGACLAFAYDALHDRIPDEQKRAIEKHLDGAIEIVFPIHERGGQWGLGNNIGAVFYAYSATIAAVRVDGPNANPRAREVLDLCIGGIKKFQNFSLSHYGDGAYPEGVLYWNFGVTWYLALAEVLQRVTGDDHGLLDFDVFKNTDQFVATMIGGDGVTVPFADSQPFNAGAGIAHLLGQRHNQPLLRWFADDMVARRDERDGFAYWDREMFRVFAAVWRDDKPPVKFPGLPTLSILESVQWGTIRSDSAAKPALQVSLKGNPGRKLSHSQPDLGSFMLYAGGEAFIIDPGYYQPESDKHSLPLVDGVGMDQGNPAPIRGWEKGKIRGLSVDLSKAYDTKKERGPARVLRHLVMLGDHTVVLLDDIVPANGSAGKVVSNLQAGQATTLSPGDGTARLEGSQRQVAIRFDGPPAELSLQGPRDFGRAWTFREVAARGGYSWHTLTAAYSADPRQPLIAILQPVQRDAAAPTVQVDRQGERISVRAGSEEVVFTMDDSGWRPRR